MLLPQRWLSLLAAVALMFGFLTPAVSGEEPPAGLSPAERGYWFLLNKAYLTEDSDQESLDAVWQVWPEEWKQKAAEATPEERRQLVFSRYGLTPRPGDDSGKPLQYVITEQGGWVMNCFSCHGGKVAGQVIPGLPNSLYALQTMTEETRAVKPLLQKRLTGKELASLFFPMGGSIGTTNAVMFGVALENYRDADLNVVTNRPPPQLTHHDMDAPPWWHFKKKKFLYADGFVEKDHRALVPFVLIRSNGPERVASWEPDFKDIAAYLESLKAPAYPFSIDEPLAEQGKIVFNNNCAQCHGTYGAQETYPQRLIPIEEIGTDPVRLEALTVEHRKNYGHSWLAHYGQKQTIADPGGYVAPPLDGIWASAPYFHNGSVPTLWHLLHPEERPAVWKRTEDGYDTERVGLEVETFEKRPRGLSLSERRTFYDTKLFGKSAAGHDYPAALTKPEKAALLEYLKSL